MIAATLIQAVRTTARIYPSREMEEQGTCRYFNRSWVDPGPDADMPSRLSYRPSCIVGHAIHMTYPELASLVHGHWNSKGIYDDERQTSFLPVVGTHEELCWLAGVQSLQDQGIRWAEAVADTDARMASVVKEASTVGAETT